jgi:hypothetical protein
MLGSEDIKNTQVNTTEQTSVATSEIKGPDSYSLPGDLIVGKIAEMFEIPTYEIGKYEHDINRILDYVNQFNPTTMDDVVNEIKTLSSKLGSSQFEQQIKTISRYLFLTGQKSSIEKDIERMIVK